MGDHQLVTCSRVHQRIGYALYLKCYEGAWEQWSEFRTCRDLSRWLDPKSQELDEMKTQAESVCYCCGCRGDQASIVKGKISTMKYFHKHFFNFQLPTQHFLLSSVLKGVSRSHTETGKRPRVRRPLTWSMIVDKPLDDFARKGRRVGEVGVRFSFFFLASASEL
ncbi:unnamed protein product [Choristocarpus tenellus]